MKSPAAALCDIKAANFCSTWLLTPGLISPLTLINIFECFQSVIQTLVDNFFPSVNYEGLLLSS